MFRRFPFISWDGMPLSAAVWTPRVERELRPVVVIHGMGEHLLRYERLANDLEADGYQVYCFDLRGHGLSPGARGDAPGLHYHVQDVLGFIDWITQERRLVPEQLPVIAHSMGGLIALRAALALPSRFKSLCLISPYFRPAFQPQAWRLTAARFLNRVWPSIALDVGLKLEQFAKDRAVQLAIYHDRRSHQKMSARMALQLIDGGEGLLRTTERLLVRCLLVHGDSDTINSHAASAQFAQGQPLVKFVTLPGGYHQIHNDEATRPLVLHHLRELLAS